MGCRVFFIFLEKHPDMKRLFFLSALFTLVCCSAPKSDMDRYVDDLMSRMTLDQKIGQLNLHSSPGFISAERVTEEDENTKMLREGMLGGIYGSGNFDLLKRANRKFDIVFADPPYALEGLATLPDLVFDRGVLTDDGIFILEHPREYSFEEHPHFWQHRAYGKVNFTFFANKIEE